MIMITLRGKDILYYYVKKIITGHLKLNFISELVLKII